MKKFMLAVFLLCMSVFTVMPVVNAEWHYADSADDIAVYWQDNDILTKNGQIDFRMKWKTSDSIMIIDAFMPRNGEILTTRHVQLYDLNGKFKEERDYVQIFPFFAAPAMGSAGRAVNAYVNQNHYPW
jgi:hypothetical protein